ncbi:hypothetical protein EBE87_15760 [Pseudoroseomonas wenyumeiae]|uniref:Uncharacterized protein n=1 Tax=Teichococcus wenyumeiae TaxID=2478470 RepID=A0A3A9JH09_9PROT|nr:hypothetical protein [Pseudoroseomonas wenyumeiae]RKK04013.1 hypothetical protein D6Z83_11720 [Pseudoroseomonas wenyumeiae]RMI19411.1 hypothetical protein EBE87_20670 [Pseudoroseomonas wenyumeiae]RMI20278.1 hypothetical protein EBE87_15760 [Pseudoroseomonas wenyumeiae]
MISAPFSARAAVSRCLTRAIEAADRGDRLEAQYWQSLAAAAQRRVSTLPAPQPSLAVRLTRVAALFTRRMERLA